MWIQIWLFQIKKKSLQDGAIEPWAKSTSLYYAQTLASIAKHYKISLSDPWKKIPKKIVRKTVNEIKET